MKQPRRTTHARKRMQQRGINDFMVRLVEEFGQWQYQKGGAHVVEISRKDLAKLRKAIDKVDGVKLVVGEGDRMITGMHDYKKTRTTQYTA